MKPVGIVTRLASSVPRNIFRAKNQFASESDQSAQPVPRMDEKPLPESETGRAIVQYLRECGDTYADDIAAALDMDLSTLLSELTLLELDGFVETLFGKHFRAI